MAKAPKEKEPTIADVVTSVNTLADSINKLVSTYEKKDTPPTPTPVAVEEAPKVFPPVTPIPLEFREIVEHTLNKQFNVEVTYMHDAAAFEFSILVPEKYSNAGKPHWQTYKEDRRSKVILNALGSNGVREWASKVYENFDAETKARITFDRAQL